MIFDQNAGNNENAKIYLKKENSYRRKKGKRTIRTIRSCSLLWAKCITKLIIKFSVEKFSACIDCPTFLARFVASVNITHPIIVSSTWTKSRKNADITDYIVAKNMATDCTRLSGQPDGTLNYPSISWRIYVNKCFKNGYLVRNRTPSLIL